MNILQVLLVSGVLAIIGGIVYGIALVFKAGPDKTKEDINKDPHF
jgi:hypothetical protein